MELILDNKKLTIIAIALIIANLLSIYLIIHIYKTLRNKQGPPGPPGPPGPSGSQGPPGPKGESPTISQALASSLPTIPPAAPTLPR